jgi:hypothetical protein
MKKDKQLQMLIDEQRTEQQKKEVGRRVRLVSTSDPHTRLKPGECGKIVDIDDYGTRQIHWDNGTTLGLIPVLDEWEYIS